MEGYIPERDSAGNIIAAPPAPFAAKSVAAGKMFRRVHGVTATLAAEGDTAIELVVPYNLAKINEIVVLWCPEGVTVDFEVFDTPTGAISTVPNAKLNQFGFGAGVAKDNFRDRSDYDADLIKDMKLKATIHNPTTTTKTVCVNFILHEVKP